MPTINARGGRAFIEVERGEARCTFFASPRKPLIG